VTLPKSHFKQGKKPIASVQPSECPTQQGASQLLCHPQTSFPKDVLPYNCLLCWAGHKLFE